MWSFRILGFVLILTALFGCSKSSDVPVYASSAEYSDNLEKAEGLSSAALEKYERGEELSAEDKSKLSEALKIFEGLIAFTPDMFGAYFGAGKIEMALSRPEKAFVYFQNFLQLAPANPADPLKPALSEAHVILATIYEDHGEMDKVKEHADKAVAAYPSHPNALALKASVLLRDTSALRADGKGDADQEKKAKKLEEEAHQLVDQALRIDPNNGRAKSLHGLMVHP